MAGKVGEGGLRVVGGRKRGLFLSRLPTTVHAVVAFFELSSIRPPPRRIESLPASSPAR